MSLIYLKFKETAEKNRRHTAVGWKEKGRWHSMNYLDFFSWVDRLAAGFRALGVRKGERVSLMSENRPEWLACDLAINKLGAISVPIHITSNKPLVDYILKDSGSGFFILSEKAADKISGLVFSSGVKTILIGNDPEKKFGAVLSELAENGGRTEPEGGKNDIASIVYTSGTTGDPKGTMLSNDNFLFNVERSCRLIPIFNTDRFLSFLPLSHVLERTGGSYSPILSGAAIFYAEGIKELSDNLKEVKPTILVAVPKIFEKIYETIFSEIKRKNLIARKMFFWSLKIKERGPLYPFADLLVYRKIRAVFGGRIRFAVSGGASINDRIIKFFLRFGIRIVEGYGLTETAPIIALNPLDGIKPGAVGIPLEGVLVKIADDKEIIVKGENVMAGYWNKEEATREAIDDEGWFRTGDLGFIDSDRYLTIIGRKKEMIVLTNGKNVAPEKVESVIDLSPFVSQSLVVGHKRDHLAALIVPDYEMIRERLGENIDLEKIIRRELDKSAGELAYYEAIRSFKIVEKPFSIENGELTATLKLRRKAIEIKYAPLINDLYWS